MKSLNQKSMAIHLKQVTNDELDARLKTLVHQERELLTEILHHINEVDCRKLYLKMAFPNLFTYLTEHLGYSAGSAQRRIDAARLLNDVPALAEKLESGDLNLSQVSVVQKALRQKKKETRTIISKKEKQDLIENLSGQSYESTQQIVAQAFDLKIQQAPQVRHQKDSSVRFEITLSQAQWEKLQKMRELLSTSLPNGSWDQVLEYVADKVINQKTRIPKRAKKRTFENPADKHSNAAKTPSKQPSSSSEDIRLVKKQSSANPALEDSNANTAPSKRPPMSSGGIRIGKKAPSDILSLKSLLNASDASQREKSVPAALKAWVLQRDHVCQYEDPRTQRKCASKWNLQVDHIQPRWAGGGNHPENLRVLCGRHNLQRYKEQSRVRSL